MTLNFTSYSAFPSSIRSDEEFGSINWDKSGDSSCWLNWEISDAYENGGRRDWTDPADLLPADPFGMELSSNLAAAIVGWFEDLGASSGDCKVYCWNNNDESGRGGCFEDGFKGLFGPIAAVGVGGGGGKEILNSRGPDQGFPHEGLMLSLGFLGVEDLLSVERVCRSLRSAVQSDPLLWRCIHIDPPLSERINDVALLRLTRRAQGSLQCLSLVECSRITDAGLRRVLESNPRLRKLSVSGCRKLSIEGLILNLKDFKSSGVTGISHLKLGRLFSVSPEQYDELQLLLGGAELSRQKFFKPRFYHCGVSSIACDDDRAIDIEMCPVCHNFKLVFDCPSESCGEKGPEHCRACDACIGRCAGCGRCVNDCKFVETFFLQNLCSGCWKQHSPSQEGLD